MEHPEEKTKTTEENKTSIEELEKNNYEDIIFEGIKLGKRGLLKDKLKYYVGLLESENYFFKIIINKTNGSHPNHRNN